MRDRLLALAAVALATVAVSACSGLEVDGSPTTGGEPSDAAVRGLPPRPEEIDIAGVNPCTLLTLEQQQQLGTDRPPEIVSAGGDRFGNPYCAYDRVQSNPSFGYSIVLITQEDVSVFLTGDRLVTAEVVSAAGFPAVEYRSPDDERGCFVGVSTMDGQYLNVQYGESTGIDESAKVACEKARVAAEMATQTLLAQR